MEKRFLQLKNSLWPQEVLDVQIMMLQQGSNSDPGPALLPLFIILLTLTDLHQELDLVFLYILTLRKFIRSGSPVSLRCPLMKNLDLDLVF